MRVTKTNKKLERKLPPMFNALINGEILNPEFKSLFDNRPKKKSNKK